MVESNQPNFLTYYPCNNPNSLLFSLGFPFRVSSKGFKTCLLGNGFYTNTNKVSFHSLSDMGSHNPPP